MGKISIDKKPIKPSEKQLSEFIPKLQEMISDAEEFKGSINELHEEYMRMYLSIPDQEVKEFPWYKASNLYVPLVRVILETLLSQVHDSLLSGKPKVVGFDGPDDQRAELLSRFYFDHVWTKILNYKTVGNDWLFNTLLDGTGIVKNYWNKDRVLFRSDDIRFENQKTEIQPLVTEGQPIAIPIVVDQDTVVGEKVQVKQIDRPVVEIVDITRLYVAPGTKDGLQYPKCPWFYEETFLTWAELQEKKNQGWENIDEELEAALKVQEIPEKETPLRKNEQISASLDEDKIRVLRFFMREVLPAEYTVIAGDNEEPSEEVHKQNFMDEKGIPEEVVVTYFPQTEKVAEIVPLTRERSDNKRPYVENRYKRVPNFFFGLGVPACMRYMQRLMNMLFNQMIDYGTIQNLPFFLYEPSSAGLLPEAGMIRPGAFIPVGNPGSVHSPRMQGDRSFWPQAMQSTQVWVERDSNINDYNIGRNPSESSNVPRTLGGQQLMLQQSQTAFTRLVEMMSEPFVELLQQVHVLYRAHSPESEEVKLFNEALGIFETVQIDAELFQEDVDFQFVLNPNREQEQATNQQLFQLLMSVPQIQSSPDSVRVLAKQLYESLGKKNFEEVWPADLNQQLAMQQAQGGQNVPQ